MQRGYVAEDCEITLFRLYALATFLQASPRQRWCGEAGGDPGGSTLCPHAESLTLDVSWQTYLPE